MHSCHVLYTGMFCPLLFRRKWKNTYLWLNLFSIWCEITSLLLSLNYPFLFPFIHLFLSLKAWGKQTWVNAGANMLSVWCFIPPFMWSIRVCLQFLASCVCMAEFIRFNNWKPCVLIWDVHALLGPVDWQWIILQWLGSASTQGCAALLAGQSIHSGNQKQGLRKWVLSEVTSHWGSTCSRSGKARTPTMGLWECAESLDPCGTGELPDATWSVAHVQHGISLHAMVGERWSRWRGSSLRFWMLILEGKLLRSWDRACCLCPGSAPFKQPLKAHGEWCDETEEWGLSFSPPSLSHLLSPCQGTCQGHFNGKDWERY